MIDESLLKDFYVRNARSIFTYYKKEERGYCFYRLDKRKGIIIKEKDLQQLLDGIRLRMDFGKGGNGIFYIDWTPRNERLETEKKEQEKRLKGERAKEISKMINEEISDTDPQVVEYASYLNQCYNYNVSVDYHHKHFIWAIRHKEYNYLASYLGHPKGWNDHSKRYFEKLTGLKLPNTKKGVLEVLSQFAS